MCEERRGDARTNSQREQRSKKKKKTFISYATDNNETNSVHSRGQKRNIPSSAS